MKTLLMALAGTLCMLGAAVAAPVEVVPYKAADKMPDVAVPLSPADVQLTGYLGARVGANEKARLLVVNEDELLGGFRKRPGSQDWVGEHVGKFLHAATLAWANTGDPALKEKIDRVAAGLIKCQDADGYLGTYLPKDHWGSWDVWVHKYDLMGLLTYYQYTGNKDALDCCRKIGDLLANTFGPGKKSIISAGTHVGMAATSVLEPVVFLYRMTGDEKYLDFAKYIVAAYDEPNGPKIVKTLIDVKSVSKTANGKAYEMMSNLVGLCELARATGDKALLTAAVNAWEDVVAHQLYITGTASHGEHFGPDFDLPNQPSASVGETCVTVTWIQLNAQLLRLTGDARYGDELERSYLNHLAGAQHPDGSKWAYYTPLEGTKPYGNGTNCCLSSGPRGMAMAPTLAYLKYKVDGKDGLAVDFFEASQANVDLGGQKVTVEEKTEFPQKSGATISFRMDKPATFGLRVRSPAWAAPLTLHVEGGTSDIVGPKGGWAEIPPREWKTGDRVTVAFNLASDVVVGDHKNAGRKALMWGPMVLAYAEGLNPGLPGSGGLMLLGAGQTDDKAAAVLKPREKSPLAFEAAVATPANPGVAAVFLPFAEAGADGKPFRVWMRTELPKGGSVLQTGQESRSRQGNINGSIIDGDPESHVVTFDGKPADEDWFAVTLDAAVAVKRVVFMHGRTFHDGGWFDASAGKPRVQVQKEKGGAWETVGTLDEYPATTATDSKGLADGQPFTLRLKEPMKVFGVRVAGKPAAGDSPGHAFSSCGELQAFAE